MTHEIYIEVDKSNIEALSYFLSSEDFPLIFMFANDERILSKNYVIYYVFRVKEEEKLLILRTNIYEEDMSFTSISKRVPAATLYEREINDMFGIVPIGHPDLRGLLFHGNWPTGNFPLRRDFDKSYKPKLIKDKRTFKKVSGEGVYEISVGPVHAGIIEPGYFRFSVVGEPIINLEATLYYTHKGIEKLCQGETIERCLFISERISGDESYTNSLAYCLALEKIAGVDIPPRGEYTRIVFSEVERLISHLGDLTGICLDVGYGFASYQFNMLRGLAFNIADELCGRRYLRSVNKLGGVRKDYILGKEKSLIDKLSSIKKEIYDTEEIIRSNSMFIDRVENTGLLSRETAKDLNAVGPSGRASGIRYDVRKNLPYSSYNKLEFNVPEHNNGDVNCRMNVKLEECYESIALCLKSIEVMPEGKLAESIDKFEPYKEAFGITEAPRGENIHYVMTGENNTIFRYKIRTPSFCNWPCLCYAVNGNIVPDFPLINKSFNLSYAGNDL